MKTRRVDFSKCKTELLVVGQFSDVKVLDKLNKELDRKLGGAIERLIKLGDFKGKEGTSTVVYGDGKIGAKRVMLVGLGKKKKATLDTVRKATANAGKKSVEMKVKNISMALHSAFGGRFDLSAMGRAIAEGVYYGSYRYDEFVTESEEPRADSLRIELIDPDSAKTKKLNKGLLQGVIIGKAQATVRTLANRPGNVLNPAALAAEAKRIAKSTAGLSCAVFDEKELAVKGMGGVLAVGAGSGNKPRFIVLKYNGAGKRGGRPTIGLVGKAVTFDAGGISIKRSTDMDQMKLDKSGGIAVLGVMKATAEMRLPINIYGVIPAVENLPSGTSYRPGDIITTFIGKTVEVRDTDAEGRLILSDGLSYAVKQKCDIIIDIATLTGSCKVALGSHMAGLMGNDEKLIKQLQRAAEESGEKVWAMPSGDEYAEEMKSKIADLRNVGSKWGGACAAAAFLRQFVDEVKWAHLDIAGVDMLEKETAFSEQGASGFGVRLLMSYLINMAGK
ncbi:MAG: hypothetical protein AMJ43_07645 [Coxiella sp. DG_40]|nr:MAG: hypothetical protein AMJ43_07645 [Coxiella sp. DG_40]